MEDHIVKILRIDQITHDVKRFRFEKPGGYSFMPGQATDVSINTADLKNETRPFTFTSLNSSEYLEFIIKIYSDHNGITNELGKLKPGAELIVRDAWGDISYKGNGLFIAGGAGITPFISIFRYLQKAGMIHNNVLIFANKTKSDIILKSELKKLLGKSFINILSGESESGYASGYITRQFLEENIPENCSNFYLCGPPAMMGSVLKELSDLGINEKNITIEAM
jgi:ferredoxin-NADP reductase